MQTMNSSIKTPYIIALTDAGLALAQRLQLLVEGSAVWFNPTPFANKMQQVFVAGPP
jgi:hypothetical protein